VTRAIARAARSKADPASARQSQGVEARGIRHTFSGARGRVTAIDGVDLVANPGEFVAVLGPSGCGKSTLLYVMAGFIAPSEGDVLLDGLPAGRPGPDRGVVFQDFVLFPWMTVLDNVRYGLREMGYGRKESKEAAGKYLGMVGLEDVGHLYAKELSGGMKQRVAIARTLATEPSVLFMDEPFGALDALTRSLLQDQLNQLWMSTRKTVVLVTHSVEEAIFLADRIYIMSPRPARVREIIPVDLPRPRDRETMLKDPAYALLHEKIWDLLTTRPE
jgi:NitT/TauT family transport system ATP-binding protein